MWYNIPDAPVAQWIEHWFPVPGVAGSTPVGCATDFLDKEKRRFFGVFW